VSVINEVVEAVIGLMNEDVSEGFGTVTRGALPTGVGIVCEVGTSSPEDLYFDKNTFVPLDLTINGKHPDLQVLSDRMNAIHSSLTRRRVYPQGEGWQITDIKNDALPMKIGREGNNEWLMASGLTVEFYWRGD
jgi:hypothetical protein